MTKKSQRTTPRNGVMVITTSAPLSNDEPFVQDEIAEMVRQGGEYQIVPMRKPQKRPTDAAIVDGIQDSNILSRPLCDPIVLATAVAAALRHPVRLSRIFARVVHTSGNRRNLLNNLASFPKAVWIARWAERNQPAHIHAYWLAHSATAAYIASEWTGIPWSATGYRWDIDAANCFAIKFATASFLRCADEFGLEGLTEAQTSFGTSIPIVLIRTGVRIPSLETWQSTTIQRFVMCCAGSFLEKKGHRYLIAAFARLHRLYPEVKLHLFGDGPGEGAIRELVHETGVGDHVVFHGKVALVDLRAFLRMRPVLVHPSIVASDGQQEGIPVTLIEAMANGAPVISTPTGAIRSLVTAGCGVLLPPADADALFDEMVLVIVDQSYGVQSALRAFARIRDEFSLEATAAALSAQFAKA
jgi:colanic acid/amylovoran biosynthesis glycosyltransferase